MIYVLNPSALPSRASEVLHISHEDLQRLRCRLRPERVLEARVSLHRVARLAEPELAWVLSFPAIYCAWWRQEGHARREQPALSAAVC